MQSRTHLYIYDEFLADRKFERMVSELETHLSTLDLQGPIVRLSPLRGTADAIQSLVRDGIKTIVVVGDDRTFDRVLPFLPQYQLPIGFIPLRTPAQIAERFFIPIGIQACSVLAARHIDAIDLAMANTTYFLMRLLILQTKATISIPGQYRIHSSVGADIEILNAVTNPKDGLLDIRFRPMEMVKSSWLSRRPPMAETKLLLPEVLVESLVPQEIQIDSHRIQLASFRVQAVPEALRLITGRQGIAKNR